jgi:hypothetical protein
MSFQLAIGTPDSQGQERDPFSRVTPQSPTMQGSTAPVGFVVDLNKSFKPRASSSKNVRGNDVG